MRNHRVGALVGTPRAGARRRGSAGRILAVVTAALLALLSACGSDGSDGGASPQAGGSTRTITTDKGSVEVPAKPTRVVSLLYSTALLLDLGVTPVGTLQEYDGDYPADEWAKVQKIPVVGASETEINYEQVAQLRPDLIVSTQRRAEDFGYERLRQIAPTAFFVAETPAEILAVLPKIADAVGKSSEVTARAKEYEAQATSIRAEHAGVLANNTFAYVEGGPDGFVANSPVSWPGLFMEKAGLRFSSVASGEREARGVRLSLEEISKLADVSVLFYGVGQDGKPDQGTSALLDNPAWANLPAVKAGHVYPIQYGYQYSYEGAGLILGQIDEALTKLS
ncbi:ABC transporter substrate-binding protein [Frankia sp. AgPm24]|uniref:ABC transporter substrate-binding protein n=1 Tax=Frankia sp. AgPm24 TaxID=631128 RepID=UPI00200FE57F|nr:ABC transporter substrate-binding protein [Frankia sp. AgPm24]MCK9920720.1 ABC transporter substrate-binding protein [Frankia sp. AgPm24]